MIEHEQIQAFTLFGGPLQRMGRRLGLVRGENTFWLGVALGLLAWGVLMLLALLQGAGGRMLSLDVIGMHVRFLVAIPLFFLCETWVAPPMAQFVRDLVSSGVVPESGRPALAAVVRRIGRLKDPWLAEIGFLAVVVVFAVAEPLGSLVGKSGSAAMLQVETGGHVGPVLAWYLWFCLPLFRFLLLRWVWHLGLWCYFLWRVRRLDLHLIPTHPDRAGGLGYLEIVQEHFSTLAMAISAVLAASFAEGIASGTLAFETLYMLVPMVLLLVAVLFIGPLFLFSPGLWACRVTGWSEYMRMASRYVHGFDRKWIRGENAAGEPLLGTPDMQSLADLNNSVTIVCEMRMVPASRRLALSLAAAVLVPMAPLAALKYPVDELVVRVLRVLTGL